MLYWSLLSFVVALAAGLFGFGGGATVAAGLAQVLFFVFLGAALVLVAIKLARDHTDEESRSSN